MGSPIFGNTKNGAPFRGVRSSVGQREGYALPLAKTTGARCFLNSVSCFSCVCEPCGRPDFWISGMTGRLCPFCRRSPSNTVCLRVTSELLFVQGSKRPPTVDHTPVLGPHERFGACYKPEHVLGVLRQDLAPAIQCAARLAGRRPRDDNGPRSELADELHGTAGALNECGARARRPPRVCASNRLH